MHQVVVMNDCHWDWVDAPDGVVGVVASSTMVERIYYLSSKESLEKNVYQDFPEACQAQSHLVMVALGQVKEYFHGERWIFELPLNQGQLTGFQRAVHAVLMATRPGETVSYAELAELAGSSGAARAVGQVMASNPFPIVVPCHRVIRRDGSLGAYSAALGVASKQHLLAVELQMNQNISTD